MSRRSDAELSREEMVRGRAVVSCKQGFEGAEGTVYSLHGRWWGILFRTDRGVMVVEPHRRSQLKLKEGTYGQGKP